jgi:hypothetical protein
MNKLVWWIFKELLQSFQQKLFVQKLLQRLQTIFHEFYVAITFGIQIKFRFVYRIDSKLKKILRVQIDLNFIRLFALEFSIFYFFSSWLFCQLHWLWKSNACGHLFYVMEFSTLNGNSKWSFNFLLRNYLL